MRISSALAAVAGLFALVAPAHAAVVADYQFQNDLSSSVQPAPVLTNVGMTTGFATETVDGQPRTVGTFDEGSGYRGQTDALIAADNYSVVMLVRFNELSFGNLTLFRKIFDFKNLGSDSGLYNRGGFLAFYDAGNPLSVIGMGGGVIESPTNYVQIALTRDGVTDAVAAYVDGVQALSFIDSGNLAVIESASPPDAFLNYFVDDGIDPTPLGTSNLEGAEGSVARIRLFNTALSPTEVAGLDRIAPVPEASAALFVMIAAVAGGVILRRTA